MLRAELCHIVDGPEKTFLRLPRDAKHQVYADIFNFRPACILKALGKFLSGVDSGQGLQFFCVCGLQTDTDPIDACAAHMEEVFVRGGGGIYLNGVFRIFCQVKYSAHTANDPQQLLRGQCGWRAAAYIYAVRCPLRRRIFIIFHMGEQRVCISLIDRWVLWDKGIKITVRALAVTERNVNIDPQFSACALPSHDR